MNETIRTRAGRVNVNTTTGSIQLISKMADTGQTNTHTLTVEMCQLLMHSLARAIYKVAPEQAGGDE